MLKKLVEKHKQKKLEKKLNKPEFKLDDLFVGEIVLYKDRKNIGFGTVDHHYSIAKKFAFLTEFRYCKYCHIKSKQILVEMGAYESIIGDYAVHNIKKFQEAFPLYMRKNNLTPSSKVSLKFIIDHEDEMNNQLDPDQKVIDMFK